MKDNTPVLLIERLSLFTFLLAWISSSKYNVVYYVYTSPLICKILPILKIDLPKKFKKIGNVDILGLYYEHMEEACEFSNEKIFDQNKQNLFVEIALHFCREEEYSIAIKKELNIRYVAPRVKTYTILKKIFDQCKNIVFIPHDNEEISNTFSHPFTKSDICCIPRYIVIINNLRTSVTQAIYVSLLPFFLFGTVILIIKKGITFSTPHKKHFTYAIDMQDYGLLTERGLDNETSKFFLYDDEDFACTKILHMIRFGLKLSPEAKKIFEDYQCPYIEVDRLKVPLRYLFRRVICDFFVGGLWCTITHLFNSNKKFFFIYPALAVMKMTMDEEVINQHYSIKVFISRDEYNPYHIIRTLIARKNNAYTVGFQWADLYNHTNILSPLVFSCYALFGEFYREFQKNALKYSKTEIIGAGVYGLDLIYRLLQSGYFPEKYREVHQKKYIIGIFGSPYEPIDTIPTASHGPGAQFHKDVIELTDEYDNIFRILKPKTPWFDNDLMEMMKTRDNLVLERDLTTPRFLVVPDLVIVMSNSTVGIEALMAGKKVLYYSLTTPVPYQKYASFSKYLVAFNREELKRNLDYILKEGKYVDDETIQEIRYRFGYKFDGNVTERLKNICRALSKQ